MILLDTRYHRDPLRSDGTILGTAQWKWLEKELNGQPSAITIIGSSIQVYNFLISQIIISLSFMPNTITKNTIRGLMDA